MSTILIGITITLLAGFLQGSYALFLKYMHTWKWENFWLIYSFVAMVIFPLIWAAIVIPNLGTILFSLQFNELLLPLLFGSMWGVASVLFGLSVVRIGVTLTYTLIIGIASVLGTVIPLFLNKTPPSSVTLLILISGSIVMLLGIGVSGYSGAVRENKVVKNQALFSKTYLVGLIIAIVAGIMSPMLNVGFVYGNRLSETARKFGVSASNATLVIWIVVLFGGFLVNIAYVLYLLIKNKSFKLFFLSSTKPALGAIFAGIFWFGSFGLFGIASVSLGNLGTSVGWAILMSSTIIVSNCWGIVTGEWKGANKALAIQLSSGVLLVLGVIIISSALFR